MWQHASGNRHLIVAGVIGAAAGAVVVFTVSWGHALLAGWVAAALSFLVLTWPAIWPLDADGTARLAKREDPGRAARDLILLGVSAASILAVAAAIIPSGKSEWPMITLGVACIVVSWLVVHTTFMLKYARLYYADPVGGMDFQQEADPNFRDFAYLAFTVGMTFQVSDTDLKTTAIRTTVLRQALVSFLFATIIIAVTINVIAGLGSS